jgi:hypothetical protein
LLFSVFVALVSFLYYFLLRRRTAFVTPIDRMRRLRGFIRIIPGNASFKSKDDP